MQVSNQWHFKASKSTESRLPRLSIDDISSIHSHGALALKFQSTYVKAALCSHKNLTDEFRWVFCVLYHVLVFPRALPA